MEGVDLRLAPLFALRIFALDGVAERASGSVLGRGSLRIDGEIVAGVECARLKSGEEKLRTRSLAEGEGLGVYDDP